MAKKHLKNLAFDYEGKKYEFGFGIEEVKRLANFSISKKGRINDSDFMKFALQKNSEDGFITDKTAKELQELLLGGIESDDTGYLSYEELIAYLIGLFEQAIDAAAKEVTPAIIKIENNNTASVTVDDETYKLMFTREVISEAFDSNMLDFNSILDIYIFGSTLIRLALEHYNKRFSVKLHDHIFLSAWATKFDEETEDDLLELIHALTYHMKEVVESGVKKSRAAIKMQTR